MTVSSRACERLVIGLLAAVRWCAADTAPAHDSTSAYSPPRHVAFAEHLFAQEEYDLSLLEYRRVLFSRPPDSLAGRVTYKIGLCYMALDRWEKALAIFDSLAEDSSDGGLAEAALFSGGTCCERQGKVAAARHRYRSVAREFRDGELADDAQLMVALTYLDEWSWLDASTEFSLLAREFRASPLAPMAERLAAESAAGIDLPRRSVTASGILSAVIPGAGQAWCGRVADGLFSCLFTCAFSALALRSYHTGSESSACLLGAVGLSFYAGTIHGARRAAAEFNTRNAERLRRTLREEAVTALR